MIITYLIFLISAILFKYLDIPGGSVLLMFAILFPLVDILIQAIRKREDKTGYILSSSLTTVMALFFTFKFLNWPGANAYFLIALVIAVFYFIRVNKKQTKKNVRFYIVIFLFLFSCFNACLTGSTFVSFYLKNDPFNHSKYTSHFNRTRLAYAYYKEGNYGKAEQLIRLNIEHLTLLLQEDSVNKKLESYWPIIDAENLNYSYENLQQIQNKTWNDFYVYVNEDRPDSRIKTRD